MTDTTTDTSMNAEKDTEDWVTGDEPATGAQLSYIKTMAAQADQEVPENLTKAAASDLIEELQKKTGRTDSAH